MQFLKGKDVKGMVKKNLNHILPYILMLFIDIKRSLQILKRIKEPDLILQQCHLSPLTDTIFLHFTWIPSLVLIASNLHTLSLSLCILKQCLSAASWRMDLSVHLFLQKTIQVSRKWCQSNNIWCVDSLYDGLSAHSLALSFRTVCSVV